MVSVEHQWLVELFRTGRALAPALLRLCAGVELPHHHIAEATTDLSELVSAEYRVDAAVELRDDEDRLVAAILVEVQLCRDERKPFTWPSYVAGLRARLECPVYLLVFCNDAAIARWAQQAIALGHPGFELAPIVIELSQLPRSVEHSLLQMLPELGVLSSIAHAERDLANATIRALDTLPSDRKALYLDFLFSRLPAALRATMEVPMMEGYKYQSDFARKYYGQGQDDGRREGKNEGLRESVFKLAQRLVPELSAQARAQIQAMEDAAAMTNLFDALIASRGSTSARRVLRAHLGSV